MTVDLLISILQRYRGDMRVLLDVHADEGWCEGRAQDVTSDRDFVVIRSAPRPPDSSPEGP